MWRSAWRQQMLNGWMHLRQIWLPQHSTRNGSRITSRYTEPITFSGAGKLAMSSSCANFGHVVEGVALRMFHDVISKMADEKPILVTGFGPFRGHPVNSSWIAVQDLKENHTIEHRGRQIPIVIREVPVVYDTVKTEIPKLWDDVKPRLCIHVGVAGRTQAIRLEKYGRNVGYNSTDILKKVPDDNVCVQQGPNEICTQFNIEHVCQKASEKLTDIQFITSSDAGRYLCDFIYYTSLHLNQGPVLFIHVPDLDSPYTKQQLSLALKHILECLLQEIN